MLASGNFRKYGGSGCCVYVHPQLAGLMCLLDIHLLAGNDHILFSGAHWWRGGLLHTKCMTSWCNIFLCFLNDDNQYIFEQ